ncbi:lymphocyte antigen 6E-like [Lissotriton helveticus]
MKGLFLFPLALALLVGAAHSLRCYTCLGASTSAECNTETNCPSGSEYCVKVKASVSGNSVVSKACAPDCKEGSATVPGGSGTVSCCKSDLCNGASSAHFSYTLLSLASVISALVIKAAL